MDPMAAPVTLEALAWMVDLDHKVPKDVPAIPVPMETLDPRDLLEV